MSHVILRRTDTNDRIECSTPTTGAALLNKLGYQWLVLASTQTLNNGKVYRCHRRIQPDDLYDLRAYSEIYSAARALVALIQPVQEVAYAVRQ